MRRSVGVIIFVIGAILVGLGVAKVFVGAVQPGAFGLLIGVVIFGLSFIRRPEPRPDAPPPLDPAQRVTRIFYEPGPVFENLRFHPRWLAAFLVIAVCAVIYHVAFVQRLTPEVIALAPIEKTIEGGWIPADRADAVREQTREAARSPLLRVTGPLTDAGGILLFELFLAAILLLLALIFGGRLNYWQALCVALYASLPVIVIEKLLSIVLLYIKSPDDISPIKGQRGLVQADLSLLFSPTEHPYLYVIGGFFGLLTVYSLWLQATGLRHCAEKISSASAWTIALILWGIGLILALILAALFPTFIS
ncbi:MAG TPA: YIP1 family protein [Pyrinomonadaceae bacterium]|nr:YIP1 family protein [Pyrinomonadaceae bacterium]